MTDPIHYGINGTVNKADLNESNWFFVRETPDEFRFLYFDAENKYYLMKLNSTTADNYPSILDYNWEELNFGNHAYCVEVVTAEPTGRTAENIDITSATRDSINLFNNLTKDGQQYFNTSLGILKPTRTMDSFCLMNADSDFQMSTSYATFIANFDCYPYIQVGGNRVDVTDPALESNFTFTGFMEYGFIEAYNLTVGD